MPHPPTTTRHAAAIDWLLGRINYERTTVIPYLERQLKLDRMRQLLTRLGSPDAGMRIVHIAGTKGKGSTAKMVAAMLTACGYKTGVYSSPHLECLEERFAIDGLPCPAEQLVSLVDRIRPIVDAMDHECGGPIEGPTFFDIVTAIALVHFADNQVDAAVVEVGLGGRLDSTNVVLPAISVITSISRDHTKQLGDTVELIAGEKAGIIKPGVPVVSGVEQPGPRGVIADIAREHGCRLFEIGHDFGVSPATAAGEVDLWINAASQREQLSGVRLGPIGKHQAHNAAVAFTVVGLLREQGLSLPSQACRNALSELRLPGRVEVFPGNPTIVVDTAHNEASAAALVQALAELDESMGAATRRTLIFSASRDKDVAAIAALLVPAFDRVLVTRYLENPRAVPLEELTEIVQKSCCPSGATVESIATPDEALSESLRTAVAGELVCVAGSFFLAAELRPRIAQLAL